MIYKGFTSFKEVPGAGLEPARAEAHRILSPACLPIPPPGQVRSISTSQDLKKKPPKTEGF